ncbi:Sec-independent protein translocase subunit TatA [Trujillonella humicola]|uniref:Sec-independent protein translocase subunit TatA n=1 Tax=Trujillonella humicola TaxID=3383699 RepID=UPI0039067ACD
MNLGPLEIGLIILAVLLLFGYKKLPDASRSLGRSLRIFKGEMKGMKDDDRATDRASEVRGKEPAQTSAPLRGEIVPPATPDGVTAAEAHAAQLEAEARAAEAQAAALRARAAAANSADTPR